jgi:methyl-accepting chemotaxis protein
MRLTIGNRITFGFGLAIVLLLTLAFASYRSTRSFQEQAALRKHSYDVLLKLEEVRRLMLNAETSQRGYVLVGEDGYLDPYRTSTSQVEQTLAQLRALTSDNASIQGRLARVEPIIRAKIAELAETIALRRDKGFEAALKVVATDRGKRQMDEIRQILKEIDDEEQGLLAQRAAKMNEGADSLIATLTVGSALALVLVALGSVVIGRSITRPLASLTEGAEKIGSGQLDHRIPLRGDDEATDLAIAFNRMAERRQKADAQIAASAAERERVLDAVTETVQKLGAASQQLLAGATQQASGMQQQTAAVTETVTVVDEVAHTSSQAAERAKAVAESARRSEEVGRVGRKAVEEVVGVINTASDQASSVAGNITSLAEKTQAIGEIVALITDIAEQTNLLALNAAIEASRAGEHGRGFSVVASEVKMLADESKKATQRVRQILGDIQKTANTAVLSTEEGTRSMTLATKSAASAGEAIQALDMAIAEVAEAAAQISASAGQQATGLSQIHQAMRDISQVSTQNLAATHQAQRAATDLTALGEKLKSLLTS